MNLKDWEKDLRKYLVELPKEERKQIIEYYREIYGDKLEEGYTGEEILEEFGSPKDCAKKILTDEGKTLPTVKNSKPLPSYSTAGIVGLVFFTLIIGLPVFAALSAIAISFAAVSFSGIATALAGVAFTFVSPFYYGFQGMSFGGIISYMGVGIASIGVGILLCIGFYYATKYFLFATIKLFKLIYLRRNKR